MSSSDHTPNETTIQELAKFIVDGGIKEAIAHDEIRAYCLNELRDLGCVPPTNRLVLLACVRAGAPAFQFAIKALGTNLSDFLQRHPLIARMFTRLANLCSQHRRKDALKENYLAYMRGEETGEFVLKDSDDYDFVRDAMTAEQLSTIESSVSDLQAQLEREIDRAIKAAQVDPLKLMDQWDENPDVRTISDRIRYDSKYYRFVGREEELELLRWFLGEPVAWNDDMAFRWLLFTGAGGTGKTRLAMEFVRHHLPEGWIGCRVPMLELETILQAAPMWQPSAPTLLVIDYPAQKPEQTKQLLERLARRSDELLHPVRVLLLERDAEDAWFDKVLGGSIKNRAFVWEGERLSRGKLLKPVSWEAILPVKQEALAAHNLSIEQFNLLGNLMFRVDPRPMERSPSGKDRPGAPRPLFVLAVTEWAKARLDAGESIDGALESSDAKREVFTSLLKNDRDKFWRPMAGNDDAKLAEHENMLALASFSLGLGQQSLVYQRAEEFGIQHLFPRHSDPDLLRGMSSVEEGLLAQLEPDLLGEFHVLTRLEEINSEHGSDTMARFCELAYCEGGEDAMVFAARCIRDFPLLSSERGFLVPPKDCNERSFLPFTGVMREIAGHTHPSTALALIDAYKQRLSDLGAEDMPGARLRFAESLVNMAGKMGDFNEWEDLSRVYSWFDELSQHASDAEAIGEKEATALKNVACDVGTQKRWALVPELLARHDALAARFPENEEIAAQEAKSLKNLSPDIQKQGQTELRPMLFDRQDALAERFPDSEDIAVEAAMMHGNLLVAAGEDFRRDELEVILRRQADIEARFPDSELVALKDAELQFALISLAGKPSTWDLVEAAFDRQKELASRFPENGAIATEELKSLYNISTRWHDHKPFAEFRTHWLETVERSGSISVTRFALLISVFNRGAATYIQSGTALTSEDVDLLAHVCGSLAKLVEIHPQPEQTVRLLAHNMRYLKDEFSDLESVGTAIEKCESVGFYLDPPDNG
ncbi:ATP-binding protein [Aurantiacibacter sp. D1-12]|uniref:ATP-binding protein n=1 Tax=Aurantiacibacter sp. D1-12 TaxID=2993658 RepID=UPI00237C8B8C|nr:ATP-binding protein [Aurantiacibacter sp. D1-12]MDE1467676.1 ATP-binding protein [Aurantiacibacter sp. D1-12]